jgi:hypothetical protein
VIQLQKSLNNQSIDNGTHLPALTKPGSVCFGCLFAARFYGRGSYFYLIWIWFNCAAITQQIHNENQYTNKQQSSK